MAKFITGHELNAELEKLFEQAQEYLILVSPYLKLHSRYESVLRSKLNVDKLELTILFGKNELDPGKSININDLQFFREFPNVEIRYEKRLHAKYYASENATIITSMNLYDYSQNNNIESGILMEPAVLSGFGTLDEQAASYFDRVIEQSELLFRKVPNRVDTSFGLGLTSKYSHSTVEVDKLSGIHQKNTSAKPPSTNGYCIKTGQPIPFNISIPINEKDYKTWKKTADTKMKGQYCHFSGETGSTSFEKPILTKNWRKAKEIHNL